MRVYRGGGFDAVGIWHSLISTEGIISIWTWAKRRRGGIYGGENIASWQDILPLCTAAGGLPRHAC